MKRTCLSDNEKSWKRFLRGPNMPPPTEGVGRFDCVRVYNKAVKVNTLLLVTLSKDIGCNRMEGGCSKQLQNSKRWFQHQTQKTTQKKQSLVSSLLLTPFSSTKFKAAYSDLPEIRKRIALVSRKLDWQCGMKGYYFR